MAGKSSRSGNWAPNPPATRYNASGKNREFYTFENAPGLGNYATGGTIIDGGDGYIYHIFTGDGTFTVNRPSAAIDSVEYLIVAGGGGSQPGTTAGGGGGGGLRFGSTPVSQISYPITIGAGGPAAPVPDPDSNIGTPSTAFGLTATGGGGGARPSSTLLIRSGGFGGSGGGGAKNPSVSPGGPAGPSFPPSTPPTGNPIPRQGYPGGPSPSSPASNGGGGGGGAGGAGSNGTGPPETGGLGGPGRIVPEFPSTIVGQATPAPVRPSWEPLVGPGGYAAGGAGSPIPSTRSAPANSGYGGQAAGTGGSGIVCVRYKKTVPYSRATGGTIEPSTHPEHPGVFRHIFTSPGDFTVTDPTLQYIDYLAVGGGGGGGSGAGICGGGGGGGGGFVSSIHTSTTTPLVIPEAYPWNPGYSVGVGEQYPVGVGTYPIGIGTGGQGIYPGGVGPGSNTTIGNPGGSQIIAAGGGGGGSSTGPVFTGIGGNGGSGGGGNKGFAPGSTIGGTATPTPLIQGNPGGGGSPPSAGFGAGGGGAGAAGNGINGGAGWYSVLSPSAYGTPGPLTPTAIYRYFAGGGGGKGPPNFAFGTGGVGGGAPGRASPPSDPPTPGIDGTTNTGGGGGNGNNAIGGVGGPGIVIIQYPE